MNNSYIKTKSYSTQGENTPSPLNSAQQTTKQDICSLTLHSVKELIPVTTIRVN